MGPRSVMASAYKTTSFERKFVLIAGIAALLFVPVFKTVQAPLVPLKPVAKQLVGQLFVKFSVQNA